MAHERIRQMLAAPGQRLPTERELSAELGIGRRAVRRALEVLEAEGLIWRKQGAGTFSGPRPASHDAEREMMAAGPGGLMFIIESRLAIEPMLARLAAQRASPDALRRMQASMIRVEEATDTDAADLWDSAFHREIARAAGNPMLLDLFDRVNAWRHDVSIRHARQRARSRIGGISPEPHRRIMLAIRNHDGFAASRAMRDHLDELMQVFLRHSHEEFSTHDAE
ncbi:MAG: FCD domain-containing protein [Paracoccus sp. (in: a-proteobacteria)]|nr:FCD domain-containing protein [Paracoccus sp. (in: a-proteobacteria)]